jgi:hypothetical protein
MCERRIAVCLSGRDYATEQNAAHCQFATNLLHLLNYRTKTRNMLQNFASCG